jgi:Tol biopolymer transport system component
MLAPLATVTLSASTRLGPYEVIAPLGAGGMGEVYRAKDTRLEREVAIKILPEGFAADEQRRLRFEREAKAISSLNHPNICALHDVGHENGTHYLVMELLEGDSLADRLAKGALPPDQVLRYGSQIADALECAHKHTVVHRDLKPGNVVLTKTGAKLLDFGLARTAAGDGTPGGSSDLMTAAKPLTEQGTIVGTFQYMAPEQLEGQEADARTDIFALGALLFEMATGRHAFEGKSRTSLIAAIVSAQPPPISSITPMCPPALDHIVRKCLEKDADERWQSAHDVAEELRWIAQAGSQAGVASSVAVRRRTRESIAWTLAALGAVVALGLAVLLARSRAKVPTAFRASLPPPPGTAVVPYDELGLALSSDGRSLAFVALARDGSKQIWIRDFSAASARPVPETQGAWYPFWSPDGRYLGFFADGKLKKVDVRGGSPQVLADAPTGRGGSWSKNDVILFAPNIRAPIQSIPASGGTPTPVTRFDAAKETSHRWPHFLPDGRHFLYMSRGRNEGNKPELGRLALGSLDSPEPTILAEDATNAAYVPPGYVLYGRSANLVAQRFELKSLRLVGEPVTVLEEKLAYWEAKNLVMFAASDDGSLVYLPGTSRQTVLTWYDRSGRTLGTVGDAGNQFDARLSPDGKKIASVRGDPPKSDIWINDLEYTRAFRFTFRSGAFSGPRWSRDASRMMFACQPKLVADICSKSFRDGGDVALLVEGPNWKDTGGWLPDGSVVYDDQNPETNLDLLVMPGDGKKETRVLLQTPFNESAPEPSPDGRWVAYLSDETGRAEVYVRSASGSPEQWQISTGGGEHPRWRGDGRELFFTTPDGKLMATSIETNPSFRPASPKALFTLPEPPNRLLPLFEDVTPDGNRFLLNLPTESAASVGFRVVLDWPALIEGQQK